MSPELVGGIGLLVLFILLFLGMPIAFAMILVGFCGVVVIRGFDVGLSVVGMVPYSTLASYTFFVMPLFLLMGELSASAGFTEESFRAAHTWLGRLPGGLAIASMGGLAAFGAVCGAGFAAIATGTRLALPEMRRLKYDSGLAAGTIVAGASLSVLIPPSLVFIVYGLIAEQSIARLFVAGVFPGILITVLYMVTIYLICRYDPEKGPPGPKTTWRQKIVELRHVSGVVIIFLVVIGGIWGGIFTPTEAAAVGAFTVCLYALARRQLTWQGLNMAFTGTLKTSGLTYAMLVGAWIYTYFTATSELPRHLANFVASLEVSGLTVVVGIMVLYIFLGCIMEALTFALLTLPIFLPLLNALGVDLIWFGILQTLTAQLAGFTPPIGMSVFIISGMATDIPMYTIFRGLLPFCLALLIGMIILVAFPQISLFLPNTMMSMR